MISRACPWINGFAHSREPLFTPEECKKIIDHGLNEWIASEAKIEKGEYGETKRYELDLNYRNVTIFQPPEETRCNPGSYEKWFVEKIYNNISTWNDSDGGYGFDISGMEEPPALMKYVSPGGKYDWHLDIGSDDGMSTRKIAYTIYLNPDEYEGGELQWLVGNEPSYIEGRTPTLGTITLFPAYILHKVSPVTSGIRYVLVGWIHGNSFR